MGKGLVQICNSSLNWFTVQQCAVVDEAMPVISSFSKLITLSLIGSRVTDGSVRNPTIIDPSEVSLDCERFV